MSSLAERLATDLDDAFPSLVAVHQDAVFATALRCTGHWHDAEEVAQETFIRAHRSLSGWEPGRRAQLRVRPWLLSICLNLVRNRVRDAGRRPVGSALDDHAGALATTPGDGPEARAERGERRGALAAALAELPLDHREAVVLRHVVGMGYAEIARTLDCPVGTAKARTHRGLRALATLLAPQAALLEVC